MDDLSALVDTYHRSLAQGILSKISRFVAASGSPGYREVKDGKGGGGRVLELNEIWVLTPVLPLSGSQK